jgi:hypothetical protein
MNHLNQRDLQLHVNVLGWLYILGHAIFLVIGGFLFVFLTGIGVASGDAQASTILGLVGTFVGGIMAVLALPGMAAGYGLLTRKNWGRILAIIVAVLNLLNFPLGTIIGLYALWVLLQEAANEYFAPSKLAPTVPAAR